MDLTEYKKKVEALKSELRVDGRQALAVEFTKFF